MAAVGVTGTAAANRLAEEADVVLAVGTRLQDFTTGSWALFKNDGVRPSSGSTSSPSTRANTWPCRWSPMPGKVSWSSVRRRRLQGACDLDRERQVSQGRVAQGSRQGDGGDQCGTLPSDAQVIGAVQRTLGSDVIVLMRWRPAGRDAQAVAGGRTRLYHSEYGFSCMGYEIAGGLGAKMARPDKEVVIMIGDGSYLMLNSEIATSVMLGLKLTIVLLDNRGYGCINRLQMATGGANFNNLLRDSRHEILPDIDFVAHAKSLGANAEKAASIADLEAALDRARKSDRTTIVLIDTDPLISTGEGGHWWDVAVPEVSARAEVNAARKGYEEKLKLQRVGD
jgi:3D-(3,5/4)-trihydroxycyclohexane-1,2-dione acylhydrolase (decyclizing)